MGKYVVFLVLAFTISVSTYTDSLRKNQFRSDLVITEKYNLNQAKNIAYIVAEAAIGQLNSNDSYAGKLIAEGKKESVSYNTWEELNGQYNVKLIETGDNIYILRSTAKVGEDIYVVEAKINKTNNVVEDPPWEPDLPWALFVEEEIKLSGQAKIIGDAGSNTDKSKGIVFTSATKLTGDLYIGPEANINKTVNQGNKRDGNIDGTIENLQEEISYTLPAFPEFPADVDIASDINIGMGESGKELNYSSFDGYYINKLTIKSNAVLKLNLGNDDRVLYLGTLDLKQGHIEIIGDGSLTIYIENNFKMNGTSSINNEGDQTKVFTYYGGSKELKLTGKTKYNGGVYIEDANLKIAGSGGIQGHIISGGKKVKITGNGKAYSRMIYAPNAKFELAGNASVVGAIVAKSFEASGGTYIMHSESFDSAISDLNLTDEDEDSKKDNKKDDDKAESNTIIYEVLYWL